MKKYILICSALIIIILTFALNTMAETVFNDDDKIQNYSRPYVEMLVNMGGISGYTDNTFKPQGTISRGEFLSMCINSFGSEKLYNELNNINSEEYNKIVKEYNYNALWNGAANDMLVGANIMELCSNYIGNKWNEPVTRAEAADMIYSCICKLTDEDINIEVNTDLINDLNIVKKSEYAYCISILFSLGIVQGDSNGKFNPDKNLTREDSAILICKAIKPELREVKAVADNPFNTVVTGRRGEKSIKNFIKTAFEPVGKVMYIYGGGWNEADNGAGEEAMTLGLCQSWIDFTNKQDSSYNYKNYDYKKNVNVIHSGLDCSGYVGWVIYNVMNDGNGYVTNSYKMDNMLVEKGLGSITDKSKVTGRKAGDIMCSNCSDCKHVYISLGMCSDGSELLLHSSPPGVQLSGTYTPDGNKNSEAVKLAEKYMKKYYNDWYVKYPDNARNTSYLTHYDKFCWSVLSDDEGYRNMTPEEILIDIFDEYK